MGASLVYEASPGVCIFRFCEANERSNDKSLRWSTKTTTPPKTRLCGCFATAIRLRGCFDSLPAFGLRNTAPLPRSLRETSSSPACQSGTELGATQQHPVLTMATDTFALKTNNAGQGAINILNPAGLDDGGPTARYAAMSITRNPSGCCIPREDSIIRRRQVAGESLGFERDPIAVADIPGATRTQRFAHSRGIFHDTADISGAAPKPRRARGTTILWHTTTLRAHGAVQQICAASARSTRSIPSTSFLAPRSKYR
jgi:hypothetical protein